MDYTTRIVKSGLGLTQHEALLALQNNDRFQPGTKIASIHNQGGHWVAKLLEPKMAEVMDDEMAPAELHDEAHEAVEEAKDEAHEEKHDQVQEKKIKELEKKIDLLLDALGISEKGEKADEQPEAPAADLPAAPSPSKKGPKGSEPLPPGSGAKLKPGEVPNKPGVTPVGAPAFASVKTAGCDGDCKESSCEYCDKHRKEAVASYPPGVGNTAAPDGAGASTPPATAMCPKCGGASGSCRCTTQGAPNVNPISPSASGPVTAFTASKSDPNHSISIRQAKAQLENEFDGFRVARIKREDDTIRAYLTR